MKPLRRAAIIRPFSASRRWRTINLGTRKRLDLSPNPSCNRRKGGPSVRQITRTVFATTFIIGLVQTAFAADLSLKPIYKPAPVAPAVTTYNWTGFYIGANLGYGESHRDFTNTITGTSLSNQLTGINSGSDTGQGWLGGGQIGFNYQFLGNWVAG